MGTPKVNDEMQLFDLVDDPFETTNLSEFFPEEINELKRIIVSEDSMSCKCFQCYS
jgi:hypothetical protein